MIRNNIQWSPNLLQKCILIRKLIIRTFGKTKTKQQQKQLLHSNDKDYEKIRAKIMMDYN